VIRALTGLALSALAAAACAAGPAASTPAAGHPPAAVPFETILQRSIPSQAGATRREVARDAAAWKALWDELREGSDLPPEPPAVDFDREMVIAAAMETQPCVARVTIRAVTQAADGVDVDLEEAPPAPNCRCIVAERPLHIVRVAKLPDPVRFTAARGVTSCGG
jgi:hypothetical protein